MFLNEARRPLENLSSLGKRPSEAQRARMRVARQHRNSSPWAGRLTPRLFWACSSILFAVHIQSRFSQTGTLVSSSKVAQLAFPEFFDICGRARQLQLG